MSDWKPGHVRSKFSAYIRLSKGQVVRFRALSQLWEYLDLEVLSTSSEGEVHLRPLRKIAHSSAYDVNTETQVIDSTENLDTFFPEESFERGASGGCPFKKVTPKVADSSKGVYQKGDLLCHEAWSVWENMTFD